MRTFARAFLVFCIYFLRSVWTLEKHYWNEQFKVSSATCSTSECYDESLFLSSIMDTGLNPCDDFYEYVCTKWGKNQDLIHYPEWSIESMMGERSFSKLGQILEEPSSVDEYIEIKNAKKFFKQCINLPHLDLFHGTAIATYVKRAAYFPMFNPLDSNSQKRSWTEVLNYYLGISGESGLFDITLRNNYDTIHTPLLHLSEPSSPFGLFLPRESFTLKQLRNYLKLLQAILKRVIVDGAHWKSYSLIEKDLTDVLVFRRELFSIKMENSPTAKRNTAMTVKELQTWHHEISGRYKPSRQIPWLGVFNILYRKRFTTEKIKTMRIIVENRLYLRLLVRLLSKTPETVIVNHLNLYFIERHLIMDKHIKDLMLDVITENGKLMGIVRYIGKRWHVCISTNAAEDAIGKEYIKRYFTKDVKEKAELLVEEMRSMIHQEVKDSTWLDVHAKNKAEQLIFDMKTTIGYPDYYDDWSVKFDFLMRRVIEPAKVDTIYSPYSNSLSVSAAYLNPPVFSPQLPDAVSYGAMGSIIAHELYHAFGPDHIQRQEREYAWSPSTMQMYWKKISCFAKQFDRYPVEELANTIPIPRINGNSTIDENIADTMGLKLAYESFRKKLWMTRKCVTLPQFPGIDCMKLFFISFAMSFCSVFTTDGMMEFIEAGMYSTPRLRVNGAVSNMEEFSKLFKCPANAPLNPRERCNLWK